MVVPLVHETCLLRFVTFRGVDETLKKVLENDVSASAGTRAAVSAIMGRNGTFLKLRTAFGSIYSRNHDTRVQSPVLTIPIFPTMCSNHKSAPWTEPLKARWGPWIDSFIVDVVLCFCCVILQLTKSSTTWCSSSQMPHRVKEYTWLNGQRKWRWEELVKQRTEIWFANALTKSDLKSKTILEKWNNPWKVKQSMESIT